MRIRIFVGLFIGLTLSGCSEPPTEAVLENARLYAGNAVGKQDAAVWDEMVCNYDDVENLPQIVTGYVNGGNGAQLFMVKVDPTGKLNGDVQLQPFTPSDDSEIGYWSVVETGRKLNAGQPCGHWEELMFVSASSYWNAIQDGMDPGEARQKMFDDQNELREIWAE